MIKELIIVVLCLEKRKFLKKLRLMEVGRNQQGITEEIN